MADIRHARDLAVGDLHYNGLASIQVPLGFVGVKLNQAGRVKVEQQDASDNRARLWEDKRISQRGVEPLKPAERCIHPLELSASEGCHTLRVCEGPIDKEMG
jgi:hypothetical protein